jgi:hypothetical protein
MIRVNADVVIALLLLVLSSVLFAETFTYEHVYLSIVGAKLWPRIVVILIFFLAAIYLIQSLRAPAERAPVRPGSWLKANRNVLAVFAFYGLLVIALPYLGLLLAGTGFVFATLRAIGRPGLRALLVDGAVAVISVGAMWAVFTFALGVVLPAGEILPL